MQHLGEIDRGVGRSRERVPSLRGVRNNRPHDRASGISKASASVCWARLRLEGVMSSTRVQDSPARSRSAAVQKTKSGEAAALWCLGKVDVLESHTDSARIRLGGALRVFHAFEMRAELARVSRGPRGACALGRVGRGGCAAYAATTIARERLGLLRRPREELRRQAEFAAMRESMGSAVFEDAWTEGRGREIQEAIRRALFARGTGNPNIPSGPAE